MFWDFLIVLLVIALPVPFLIGVIVVKEGTYTAFTRLGGFVYGAMEFKDFYLESNGAVTKGSGLNYVGGCPFIFRIWGLIFYIKGLVRPVPYLERNDDDGFGSGFSVFLNEIQLEIFVSAQETKDKVPLDVPFISVVKVVDPYLYLFVSPKDARKQIENRLDTILRGWIANHEDEYVQTAKGNGKQFWDDILALGYQSDIDEIRKWGFEVVVNNTTVKDIRYDEEFQNALKAEKQQKLQAEANLAQQRIDSTTFAAKTTGRAIAMISEWVGIPVPKLQEELRAAISQDPEHGFENWLKKYPIVIQNWNLIQQEVLGVRPILFGNADSSPLDSITATLASLVSLGKGGNT